MPTRRAGLGAKKNRPPGQFIRAVRIHRQELDTLLERYAPATRRRVLALRNLILRLAPEAAEGVRFGCLCYFRAGAQYGSIGGNVCMIEVRGAEVRLAFIQGASLADPERLLEGRAKAKRSMPIEDASLIDRRVHLLVRAAAQRAGV